MRANFVFDFNGDRRILSKELTRIVFSLANFFAVVAVPSARLFNQVALYAKVDNFTLARDALAIKNIELGLFKGRCNLVLDHLNACFRTNDFIAFFK